MFCHYERIGQGIISKFKLDWRTPQLGDGYIGLVFPGVPNKAIVCFQLHTGNCLPRRLILFIEFFVEMDMSELTPAEGRIC